jgi:hypothetical protein
MKRHYKKFNPTVLENAGVWPPIPEHFKPAFLIGKNAIRATVQIELNAVFSNEREIPRLKETMRLALWQAAVHGTDKTE